MADKNAVQDAEKAPEAEPETTQEVAAVEAEPKATDAPAPVEAAAGDPHPAVALVDALEKALEAELPSLTMLMVQASCAEIRKHLS